MTGPMTDEEYAAWKKADYAAALSRLRAKPEVVPLTDDMMAEAVATAGLLAPFYKPAMAAVDHKSFVAVQDTASALAAFKSEVRELRRANEQLAGDVRQLVCRVILLERPYPFWRRVRNRLLRAFTRSALDQ